MATKAQKVRLSLFLIISSAMLMLFFIVLVGNRLLTRMDTYYIVYENVSVNGLEPGAAVKYHGVQVGRVAALRVRDAASVMIEIEVEHDTPIQSDTEAILTLVGITGLKFVELIGGSPDAPLLEPGETIVAGESILESISGSAEIILAKVEQLLNNINKMTGPETAEAFTQTLVSLAGLSAQMDTLFRNNRTSFTASAENLSVVLNNLASTTTRLDSSVIAINAMVHSGDLQGTLSNINEITAGIRTGMDSLRIDATAREFRLLVANANRMVISYDQVIGRAREDILRSLQNLDDALNNLREATDAIRENPSVLIRGRQTTEDRIE